MAAQNNNTNVMASHDTVSSKAPKRLVPQLRFNEFDDEWKKKKLSEVSVFHDSKRIPLSQNERKDRKGEYPYYGASGIIDYVDDYIFDGEFILLGEDGANILMRNSPLAFIVKGKFWVNNHAHVIEAKGSNIFLSESLERLKYDKYNTGTAQPKLNAEVCKRILINLPSLPEQQKIAQFLTAVDSKLQQLNQKKELLAQYKKGVMQQLFSQQLRFKQDDGSDYPDWEEKRLGEVFNEITEKVGDRDIETYSISAGIGFVSQKEKWGKDISGKQNPNYTIVNHNQFSYNKGNSKSYNYGCVYLNLLGKSIAVPNVFISFELANKAMSNRFYAHLFEHHYLDRHLRRIISSSARMDGLLNINKKYFFDIIVPVPSIEEQQKIANYLSAIDTKIETVTQQIEATQQFKKGLLQQMFV